MICWLLYFFYKKKPKLPEWLIIIVLIGILIYIYINFFTTVAYAAEPDAIIMQGREMEVYRSEFEIFKRQFIRAMDICAWEIDNGSVTYQEIMAKQQFFTQRENYFILKTALECKCNQPNLGLGSTAFIKEINGQITQSATLRQLLS